MTQADWVFLAQTGLNLIGSAGFLGHFVGKKAGR